MTETVSLRGVASRVMQATVALFDRWGTAHACESEQTKDPIRGERS